MKVTFTPSPLDERESSPNQSAVTLDAAEHSLSSPPPFKINSRVLTLTIAAAGLGWWLGYSAPVPHALPPIQTTTIISSVPPSPPVAIVEAPTPLSTFSNLSARNIQNIQPVTPLRLTKSRAVPLSIQRQIKPVYKEWEHAHSEGAARVDHLISLYAPNAQIYQLPGQLMSLTELRSLAVQMRDIGRYISVEDQSPLLWAMNSEGSEVEILADQRYGHKDGSHTLGQRRLLWKKFDGDWKVVRDDFPPVYTPES